MGIKQTLTNITKKTFLEKPLRYFFASGERVLIWFLSVIPIFNILIIPGYTAVASKQVMDNKKKQLPESEQ